MERLRTVLILPHNHTLDYNGFAKNTPTYYKALKAHNSDVINRILQMGNNRENNKTVKDSNLYIDFTNVGYYLHNHANYQKISALLNRNNVATLRLNYREDSYKYSFDIFKEEIVTIIKKLKEEKQINSEQTYILGHGFYGVTEAILLSEEIENDGIMCIGDLAVNINQKSENCKRICKRKRWVPQRVLQEVCYDGYIEKNSKYLSSLAKISGDRMTDILEKCNKPIWQITLGEDIYASDENLFLGNDCIKKHEIEGLYHTLRKGKRKDYTVLPDVTRQVLREERGEPCKLILEKEIEVDQRVLNILEEWMMSI